MVAKNHVCTRLEGKLEITDYTSNIYLKQGGSNTTKVTVKNTGGYTLTTKLSAITNGNSGISSEVTPASYSLNSGNSGIFTINFLTSSDAEPKYYTVTIKAYANENTSVFDMKTITIGVEPSEESATKINESYLQIKELFASLVESFNQLPPSTDPNYTIANRTYHRLLNMIQDAEKKISLGEYLDAKVILDEANASLESFKQELSYVGVTGFGDSTMMLVAVFVVLVVIGGFLAYLLLPEKKGGFHPTLGYVPQPKLSLSHKLSHLLEKIKEHAKIKGRFGSGFGKQKTLAAFEKPLLQPQPLNTEKKTYAEGYHRLDEFPLSYDKDKFKEKNK